MHSTAGTWTHFKRKGHRKLIKLAGIQRNSQVGKPPRPNAAPAKPELRQALGVCTLETPPSAGRLGQFYDPSLRVRRSQIEVPGKYMKAGSYTQLLGGPNARPPIQRTRIGLGSNIGLRR